MVEWDERGVLPAEMVTVVSEFPLVSCVCPTGNRPHLITMAIDCFLAQTYPNKELIVLDDGATPTSVPCHPSIKYVRHVGPKLTTGRKRNRCNELASGSVICNWDDDDWSHPTRISVQVNRLQASGRAFTGFNQMYFHATDGSFLMQECGGGLGTAQCYTKSFWEVTRYREIPTTEDVQFCQSAERAGESSVIAGDGLMVARRHGANSWNEINILDRRRCTPVYDSELPASFLVAMGLHAEPHAPGDRPAPFIHKSYGVQKSPSA